MEIAGYATIEMTLSPKSGFARGWALGIFLTLALSAGAQDRAPALDSGSQCTPASRFENMSRMVTGASALPASSIHSKVRNYMMDLAGDHSLDVATVTEQPSTGYAKYIIQLHLASGAEQSVVVTAPPGGLQIEMRDMTGDKVPNDLLLRPAMFRRLPTVLMNDGNDHYSMVISAADPGSMSSSKEVAPGRSDGHGTLGLRASGFRSGSVPNRNEILMGLNAVPFVAADQSIENGLEHPASSGRAPPRLQESI